MISARLAWVREAGLRMHGALRQRLLDLYRPPRWLPCWFYRPWLLYLERFVRLPLIIEFAGDGHPLRTLLQQQRCRVTHQIDRLGCLCAPVRVGLLRELCSCRGVRRLWLDQEVSTVLDTAVPAAGARRAPAHRTGRGVTVAVLDTGIHPHLDLQGRIIAFADFVGRRAEPYDDNGHGTHVAGCVAGSGARSAGAYRGMAPGAAVVGVKVLNKMGAGLMSGLLAGIDWVLQNRDRYHIRVLTLSLGARPQGPCRDDPLCKAVETAWQAGLTVVVAAGNEGPEPGTIATPGISPLVITVGAMDDRGSPDRDDDTLAPFSSRGPAPDGTRKPDVLAPGVAITSLRAPGSFLDKQSPAARVGEWYTTLSGTSMAAPAVAGAVALLLEAEPALTPDAVKGRLLATAADWGLAPNEQGAGYVDTDRALGLEGA